MPADRTPKIFFLILLFTVGALCWSSPALADEDAYGRLDFSKLNKEQEDSLWQRIKILAFEEALVSHCGQSTYFEQRARQAIQACVTADALSKAGSVFRLYFIKNTEHINSLGPKWVCKGPITVNGHRWDDEGVVVADSKQDLDRVVDQVRDMCQRCKSSIWAIFCN
jgi:hypothetical protein